MQFVNCNHPILTSQSKPLTLEEIQNPIHQKLFDEMLRFARGEQTDQQKQILVGLAAPQIGFPLRIILVDVQADGKGHVSDLRVYINPEIIELSSNQEEWYEGCYSTGNVKGVIMRASHITIQAFNPVGKEITESYQGYVARIFQHEIDHLNGIRFPEKKDDVKVLHLVKPEEMYAYRNNQKWRNWPVTVPKNAWQNYV